MHISFVNSVITSTLKDAIVLHSPSNQGLYTSIAWNPDGVVSGDLNNTPWAFLCGQFMYSYLVHVIVFDCSKILDCYSIAKI